MGRKTWKWFPLCWRLHDRLVSPFTQKVVEAVNSKPDDRILDVGCGGGSTTLLLAEAGADIRGLDISKKMISKQKTDRKIFLIFHSRRSTQKHIIDPGLFIIFSPFGVMFFSQWSFK